jgi:hypothetical protein
MWRASREQREAERGVRGVECKRGMGMGVKAQVVGAALKPRPDDASMFRVTWWHGKLRPGSCDASMRKLA